MTFPENEETKKIVVEKKYHILNKQYYVTKRGVRRCKLNCYEPGAERQFNSGFAGSFIFDLYVDERYYNVLNSGLYCFVFELPPYGHQLELVNIRPCSDLGDF